MDIYFPKNLFASLLADFVAEMRKANLQFCDASLISKKIKESKNSVGLMPSLDLLYNKDLFVSNQIGITFDGVLSNSYLYFSALNKNLNEILLYGDVSANDLILNKIIFSEHYHLTPEFKLSTTKPQLNMSNCCITGYENFENDLYKNGISLSDQLTNLIRSPYVEFLLVSNVEENISEFLSHIEIPDVIDRFLLKKFLNNLNVPKDSKSFLEMNFDTVRYKLLTVDIEAVSELLKLPYYKRIVREIIDINYV